MQGEACGKTTNSIDPYLEEKATEKEVHPKDEEYGGYAGLSQTCGKRSLQPKKGSYTRDSRAYLRSKSNSNGRGVNRKNAICKARAVKKPNQSNS